MASILEDNTDYYDLIESGKPNQTTSPAAKQPTEPDGKVLLKENDLMKRRNEHLLQILLEFENENKLLSKGLVEIDDQIRKLNLGSTKGGRGQRSPYKMSIIGETLKCKLVSMFFSRFYDVGL